MKRKRSDGEPPPDAQHVDAHIDVHIETVSGAPFSFVSCKKVPLATVYCNLAIARV